jgi:predicted transcriptional regulator
MPQCAAINGSGRGTRTVCISVKPEYAEEILDGVKRIELRRLRPKLNEGDQVVLYATQPIAAIVGAVVVTRVISETPRRIWQDFSAWTGLSEPEYKDYFRGRRIAFGILVARPLRCASPLHLTRIKDEVPGFAPPQGYWYLSSQRYRDSALLAVLSLSEWS